MVGPRVVGSLLLMLRINTTTNNATKVAHIPLKTTVNIIVNLTLRPVTGHLR